jgi:hypothetical protein
LTETQDGLGIAVLDHQVSYKGGEREDAIQVAEILPQELRRGTLLGAVGKAVEAGTGVGNTAVLDIKITGLRLTDGVADVAVRHGDVAKRQIGG